MTERATIHDLARMGVTVRFLKEIEDSEGYAEAGMMAKMVKAWDEHDFHWVTFDFEPFKDYNRALETPNYFDDKHNPCLTATEAGYYKPQDDYGIGERWDQAFEVVEPDELMKRFFDREDKSMGYVAWLEHVVRTSVTWVG